MDSQSPDRQRTPLGEIFLAEECHLAEIRDEEEAHERRRHDHRSLMPLDIAAPHLAHALQHQAEQDGHVQQRTTPEDETYNFLGPFVFRLRFLNLFCSLAVVVLVFVFSNIIGIRAS